MFNFATKYLSKYLSVSLALIVVFLSINIYIYRNNIKLLESQNETLKNSNKHYKYIYTNLLNDFRGCEENLKNLQKYNSAASKKVKEYQAERRKYEKVKLNSLDDVISFAKRLQQQK